MNYYYNKPEIDKFNKEMESLFCKHKQEMCDICQPLCEEGRNDCRKCSSSIKIDYKGK